ncbi:LamG-like jellyroll fold domain-containing protein [Actinoplanes sp. HUAS TT8]|uniref:LamG-like jellyroll fold domain-containing protein n=1 Tax=Actinoplanes sp. HUAS TT8 TaxID=3447453 RepID=UPI003F51E9F1
MDDTRGPGIDTPAGYTRLRRIGSGAEADVYQAWEEHTGTWTVLRLFHGYIAGRLQEQDFTDRYGSAARLGGHPGIVPVRAGGITATGRAWLATDLVDGDTLADRLAVGPMPLDDALALTAVLADALAWAHATQPPMTHGRIDAEHVLLTPDGRPMLTGFALAAGRRSTRADVAALAALLGHALTGRPGMISGLPPALAAVPGLARLLSDGLSTNSAAEFAYRLRDVTARRFPTALAAPSGTYPAVHAPSGAFSVLHAPSGAFSILHSPGAHPAPHGSGGFPASRKGGPHAAPHSPGGHAADGHPAGGHPVSGAYPVLSDAMAARLTAPAAGQSSLSSKKIPSPYGGKRRRLAGIVALAAVAVLAVAAGVVHATGGRTSSDAAVPLTGGAGGAAIGNGDAAASNGNASAAGNAGAAAGGGNASAGDGNASAGSGNTSAGGGTVGAGDAAAGSGNTGAGTGNTAVGAGATACPPATTDLATGSNTAPALWWPLDGNAGTIACDASGNGNTATLGSAAGWRSAAPKALSLTAATGDSYAAGRAPAVRTDRSFTVMAWVYLTDKSGPHGVLSQPGKVSSGFNLKYEKSTDSWRLTMPRTDSRSPVVDGPSSTSRPALKTWTHLAARYDAGSGKITLFVNGRDEDSAEHPRSWNATGAAQIARSWYNGAWTDRLAGAVTDVRAYQEALPSDEITAISKLKP